MNETRIRSFLKAFSFRLIEIGVDTGLILVAFTHLERIAERIGLTNAALILAVLLEGICLGLHYLFERLWNRSQWGREIKEVKCGKM